jgi:hypothetical protein
MCFVNRALVFLSLFLLCISAGSQDTSIAPGTRSVMDAHNCYPYFEWWADRIDRALSAGVPLVSNRIWTGIPIHTMADRGRSWRTALL